MPLPGLLALLACALVAWFFTILAVSGMPSGPGAMGLGVAGYLAGWELMMAAMMLPALAPLLGIYLRSLRSVPNPWVRAARTAALVVGYLAAWAVFGILAYGASILGGALAALAPTAAPWVGAGLLAAAGAYQLTPLKNFCLRHCRSPVTLLLHVSGYKGPLRDVRAGIYHGAYCTGCCWGLMLVLVIVGTMNLAWMAVIAAVVLLEKTWRHGIAFSRVVGACLIVFAVMVPFFPELLPGLYTGPGMDPGMGPGTGM
ncbi:DUF2182 domain-containing protein [Paeniglutamicibacter sp. R2-26]|uniref:DUF2182 domain-containing protein n=1 Tax=Paeniglutamicibacter sp. R2-26 TaxID=3144417 RepID=UPI003EE7CB4A